MTRARAASGEIEKNSEPASPTATRVSPAELRAWARASRAKGATPPAPRRSGCQPSALEAGARVRPTARKVLKPGAEDAENEDMSDLSRLLDDVYRTTPPAPGQPWTPDANVLDE